MERNNSKVRVFFIKILRILLTPISRLRKLIRKWSMRQTKIMIGVVATITIISVAAYLCWLFIFTHKKEEPEKSDDLVGTPLTHVPLDEIYRDLKPLEDNDYNLLDDEPKEEVGMIHTPGCRIPLAVINYRKYRRNVTKNINEMCGKRAVFLRKYDDDKVIARIKTIKMDRSTKNVRIQCCYKFIVHTLYNPHERDKLLYSNCTDFQDESIITLQSDFINVICSEFDENNESNIIYEDMYAFNKKIQTLKSETKTSSSCNVKYNVLILGMESMSLPRFLNTMPRSVGHFADDSWLGFQGYNKVADDTLPNVMAALTGKNMTSIIRECFASMDDCNYFFIWKAFKDAGYATAYGEDNFGKTFSKDYAFHKYPTDHYMQPFFLKEEYHRNNQSSCAGKISAGQQLLDYAVDFANTYKKESFFGFFWINSFSRNEMNRPEYADKLIENFMNQLIYTGVLTNTFIMFLSAHGLRFGRHRHKMESFYDDRLPMKFIWTPLLFKGKHSDKYKALVLNQRRLTTPYDIYSTLLDIKRISLCSNSSDPVPEGCPNCHSLLELISGNRTCKEVAIHERWCTCHKLYPLTVQDPIGLKSVNAAVSYIQGKTMNIETQSCWGCARPYLQNVTRIHFYYDEDKTKIFYVVAISMSPSNTTYEALVLRKDGYRVVGPISPISYYQGSDNAAITFSVITGPSPKADSKSTDYINLYRYTAREDFRIKETQDFLIDTPGCYIPNYAKTYKHDYLKKESKTINMCGVRYVFIDTIGDDKIKFRMYKFIQGEVRCCYRFAKEFTIPGHEHDLLSYTPCEIFTNNTIVWLEQEVITVTCTNLLLPPGQSGESKTDIIYKDTYMILKKINESNSQSETNKKSMKWNVLMIGLDGMSRTRLFDTMPHTTKYLKKHKWLDFKAYQKVGDNSFPNLMSILTGKRMPTIYSNCTSDLEKCADLFIWKKYKYNGYKTAHGESNLLSDTFYSGFKKSPTDHCMRPLLRAITSNAEDILCIGNKPSASHLLKYAHKFVDAYKANTFFGVFWINTYISYNDIPQLSDTKIVKFFRKLNGVLNNTFVIFFSDQGISFGAKRHPVESYYDNQLPMLFVWTPLEFRSHYTNINYNLHVNQERLITPYDVYITLGDILKLSINSSEEIRSEACPQCTSLFRKLSPNRTCADAGVGETWCACHDMLPVTTDDKSLENSISAAVAHIKNIRNSIKTVPCTSCEKLKYPTIFRAHEYYEGEKTYHVIAFRMSPNKLEFEALVVHYEGRLDVLTVRSLARYNDRGNCAVHSQDRPFCVCAFNTSCIPENESITNFSNLSVINLAELILSINSKFHKPYSVKTNDADPKW